ncbi:hypothetical protein [Alterisphingorhabdus coralli]|uniref:Uncharacterized protein n=1 Tax=Alterisphingorhabdus coralli TaxID=3071408 RepID=A0AA97F8C6_9SPHN|nr:hypothetical protein [Parasphingorhabdus sp. SCSIO 66989]WOE74922.1 hypothetical protein RB602_13945 [Parasphingorhabdus sp. SCSIO 66989]
MLLSLCLCATVTIACSGNAQKPAADLVKHANPYCDNYVPYVVKDPKSKYTPEIKEMLRETGQIANDNGYSKFLYCVDFPGFTQTIYNRAIERQRSSLLSNFPNDQALVLDYLEKNEDFISEFITRTAILNTTKAQIYLKKGAEPDNIYGSGVIIDEELVNFAMTERAHDIVENTPTLANFCFQSEPYRDAVPNCDSIRDTVTALGVFDDDLSERFFKKLIYLRKAALGIMQMSFPRGFDKWFSDEELEAHGLTEAKRANRGGHGEALDVFTPIPTPGPISTRPAPPSGKVMTDENTGSTNKTRPQQSTN